MSKPTSTSQRNERLLNELKAREGNNQCADCGARQPRWASWSLGIWLCVKCATIHRRMGTHISKVKSLSLDIWTKEQVESMRDNGNIKSNQLYNPFPERNPPPLDLESDHPESALERYIFQKYRDKAFMEKPKKKSSKPAKSDLSPSPAASRLPPASVAPIKQSGTNVHNKSATPDSARTSSASNSSIPPSHLAATAHALESVPALQQFPSAHLSVAAASAGRAMTAPLPDHSQRPISPSVPSSQGHNPFLRQMTASAQIPSATGGHSPAYNTGYNAGIASYQPSTTNPYMHSNLSASHNPSQTYNRSYMPQLQPAPPKGEVWDDLAGLSLSNNANMGYPQTLSTSSNGYKPHFSPIIQTNPFLQSSSMPYKSPSQISSVSSGSSFSSVGSLGSSLSPQYSTQIGFQQTMPAPQHQLLTPVPQGMSYMPSVQQQQQPIMTGQIMMQQHQAQPPSHFHSSNPYAASQFGQLQQPYPQHVQGQMQFQGM